MDEQRYPQIDSNKNRLHKKMCRSKDQLNKKNFGTKVKNYKKVPLKLTGNSKANNFHNFFRGNKLNLFKTWEGIREIINISKNRKSHKGVPRKSKFTGEHPCLSAISINLQSNFIEITLRHG